MDPSLAEELNSRYKTAISIEIAVLLVVLLLAVAGWFWPVTETGSASDLTPLWILVLFIAAGTFVLRRSLTRWGRLRDIKLMRGNSGLFRTLVNNTLFLCIIAFLVATAGFFSMMFSGDKFDMLRAAAVAIILLAVNFPRRKVWQRIVEALSEV